MQRLLLLLSLLTFAATAHATTYYVRTDGGPAPTCNGAADAPASAAPNCAFNHPFWVLVPGQGKSLMKSGDTLSIGPGSYMMGYGAPNVAAGNCNSDGQTLCYIKNIPSGISASQPTVITGDCKAPPELWGSGGASYILDMESGAHDITIQCLDMTDHSTCITNYPLAGVPKCVYGSGPWAETAIRASGVANLTLQDLTIHGLASTGVWAGGLSGTTTVTRVKILGIGRSGWDMDLGGSGKSSNSGTLTFTDLTIAWTGCSENYPVDGKYSGCFGQNEGGYGDGFSLAKSGGTFVFIRPIIYKNTQDGLDLLYADGTGKVTIDHGFFSRNAGNDLKTSGNATVTNNVILGDCQWWKASGYPAKGDACRAGGGVEGNFTGPNQTITFAHNTMIGNGSGLYESDPTFNATSTPVVKSDVLDLANNIFIGSGSNWLIWAGDPPNNPATVKWTNNLVWNVRENDSWTCKTAGTKCVDPKLTDQTFAGFNPVPLPGSPALNTAVGAQP